MPPRRLPIVVKSERRMFPPLINSFSSSPCSLTYSLAHFCCSYAELAAGTFGTYGKQVLPGALLFGFVSVISRPHRVTSPPPLMCLTFTSFTSLSIDGNRCPMSQRMQRLSFAAAAAIFVTLAVDTTTTAAGCSTSRSGKHPTSNQLGFVD